MDIVFIEAIIVIGLCMLVAALIDGQVGRKRIVKSELAKPDATIINLEPKTYGTGKSSHYELIVHFSDGTSYRDVCNKEERHLTKKTYWLDKEKAPEIISAAMIAHQRAVERNQNRVYYCEIPGMIFSGEKTWTSFLFLITQNPSFALCRTGVFIREKRLHF